MNNDYRMGNIATSAAAREYAMRVAVKEICLLSTENLELKKALAESINFLEKAKALNNHAEKLLELIKEKGWESSIRNKAKTIYPVEDRLESLLDWESNPSAWAWRTATEIALYVGVDNLTKSDANAVAAYLRGRENVAEKRVKGKRLIFCPPLKENIP